MKQLPQPPATPNERALASQYIDSFTGRTGTSITLSHPVAATVDGIGLAQVFKNGVLLSTIGGGAPILKRETFTGVGSTFTLAHHPMMAGTELVFRNGQLLDGHGPVTVSATSIHVTASGTDSRGDTVTVTGAGTGTFIPDPGNSGYSIDGTTGVVTPGDTPDGSEVFTVLYWYAHGASDPDYTIDGSVLTVVDALVASDSVLVFYPYRQ